MNNAGYGRFLGRSKREIAKRLGVSRTSVIRWLDPRKRS